LRVFIIVCPPKGKGLVAKALNFFQCAQFEEGAFVCKHLRMTQSFGATGARLCPALWDQPQRVHKRAKIQIRFQLPMPIGFI
jgi:hypothetical protein